MTLSFLDQWLAVLTVICPTYYLLGRYEVRLSQTVMFVAMQTAPCKLQTAVVFVDIYRRLRCSAGRKLECGFRAVGGDVGGRRVCVPHSQAG